MQDIHKHMHVYSCMNYTVEGIYKSTYTQTDIYRDLNAFKWMVFCGKESENFPNLFKKTTLLWNLIRKKALQYFY